MLDPSDRMLFRRVWGLTWPMILANALDMIVGLFDLVFVRPFGPEATAAIGVSRQVTVVVEGVAAAIAAGVLTLVSQGIGAHAPARVDGVIRQSIGLVLVLGLPITLAGLLLSGPILVGLQVSAETLAWGEPYLRVYFAGLVFSWGNLVGMAVCRGAGDVWTPLKVTLGVSLLTIALNYLLIHGMGPVPALAVMGAALGTVIARVCGVLAYLTILHKRCAAAGYADDKDSSDIPPWRRILRVGAPLALTNLLRHGSRVVFLAIAGASVIGVSLQAVLGMGMQVRLLGVLIALAFQTSTAALVGQAIGQGDASAADKVARRSLFLISFLLVPLTMILLVLAEPLATLFIASTEGVHLGALVLRWFAVAQLLSALSITMQGALMGAGDTVPALHYTILSEWGIMLALAYLFVVSDWFLPESLLASWTIAPAITLAFTYRRWRRGRWKEHRVC